MNEATVSTIRSKASVNECKTKLITDAPVNEDLLGGAHGRISQAIYRLVINEEGGKSIGLEGDYGSGKTTVVNILQENLKLLKQSEAAEKKHCEVIVFDAWALEGDPLRRAFLEGTIHKLMECGWIDKKWEKRIDELAQRQETQSTETHPEITTVGKFVGVSLVLVPVGLAVLNAALRDTITLFEWENSIHWKFVTGLGLMLSPLMTLGIAWIIKNIKSPRPDPQKSEDKEDEAENLWGFLYNRSITKEITRTSKTPNPTALEFESDFKKIMEEALREKDDRRLVFVFDNLDRVEAEVALEIWSTLQTFVGHTYRYASAWSKQVWVIVLFDPESLRAHLGKEDEKPVDPSAEVAADNKAEFSSFTAFLDKTFQLRFRVPPPLLSKWSESLAILLKEAFPDHKAGAAQEEQRQREFHEVYRVYETYFSHSGRIPTIRKLKLFVNQIGAIHQQWGDAFPLAHAAYFNLFQNDIKHTNWFDHPLPAYQGIFDNEEQLVDNLLAMSFNVEVDLAREIVLAPKIKEALTGPNKDQLKQLAGYGKSFWLVLEKLFTNNANWLDHNKKIASAAGCFYESNLFEEQMIPPYSVSVQRALGEIGGRVLAWTDFNRDTAKGVAGLCRWSHNDENSKKILKAVLSGLIDKDDDEKSIDVREFIEGLIFLDDALKLDGAGAFFSEHVIGEIGRKLKTKYAADAAANRLAPVGVELKMLLISGFELGRQNEDARLLYEGLNKEGVFLYFLNHALRQLPNQDKNYAQSSADIIAWCLFLILRQFPDALTSSFLTMDEESAESLERIFQFNESAFAEDKIAISRFTALPAVFTEILLEHDQTDLLFEVLKRSRLAEPFIARCSASLLNSEKAGDIFNPKVIAEHWAFLNNQVAGYAKTLRFSEMIFNTNWDDTGVIDEVMSRDFDPADADLYGHILFAGKAQRSSEFGSWCEENLRNLLPDDWEQAIGSISDVFLLALDMYSSKSFSFGDHYILAAEKFAKSVLSGRVKITEKVDAKTGYIWSNAIVGSLIGEGEERSRFREKLWDWGLNSSNQISEDGLQLLSAELVDLSLLPKGRPLMEKIFLPFLRKGGNYLEWLVQLISKADLTEEDLYKYDYDPSLKQKLKLHFPQATNDKNIKHLKVINEFFGIESENSDNK